MNIVTPQIDVSVGPGTRADLDALAHLHYRAGPPATIARGAASAPAILAARNAEGTLAGVLAISMPTLNASWRALAWPGAYVTSDKRARAAEINRTLRCLSRCIVDPRFRAQGVARRLVASYLRAPLTERTEAIAAMGRTCPFLERAGMRAYVVPPTRRDARFTDALASVGLEPWEMADPDRATDALKRHPWLAHESRTWANGARNTRRHLDALPSELIQLASLGVAQRPIAYAHTRGS